MSELTKIRIMLVDDHNLFREGLASMLGMSDRIEVVAEVARGDEAVMRALEMRPEIVLLNLHLPGMGGIDICKAILKQLPDTRIVMLTISKDLPSLYEAMKAGACGYLIKDIRFNELVDAVVRVHREGGLPESLSDEVVHHVQALTEEEMRAYSAHGVGQAIRRRAGDSASHHRGQWEPRESPSTSSSASTRCATTSTTSSTSCR